MLNLDDGALARMSMTDNTKLTVASKAESCVERQQIAERVFGVNSQTSKIITANIMLLICGYTAYFLTAACAHSTHDVITCP